MSLTIIATDHAPKAIGPYSQAIRTGELVFCSGQIALDPATSQLIDGDIEAQTQQALTNLSHVLTAAGSDLSRVVKTTVFLADIADFARMNTVYAEFFGANPPARSALQAAALPRNAKVEVECVALAS